MLILPGDLAIGVSFTCNLNCRYCGHLAPWFNQKKTPHVTATQIEQICLDWSGRVQSKNGLVITGGEPLQNPDIEPIIEILHKHWQHEPKIRLITNGLLLEKMPSSFFDTLERRNVITWITVHHVKFWEKLKTSSRLFRSPYWFWDHTGTSLQHDRVQKKGNFVKNYEIVDGLPVFGQSDARTTHDHCGIRRKCAAIVDNQLFYCGNVLWWRKAHQENILFDERMLACTPATPDMTDAELQTWWDTDFYKICDVCSAKKEFLHVSNKFE